MSRTPEQRKQASKARNQASTKLRRMGYRFAKQSATEPAPGREFKPLHAAPYRLDRWLRYAAARAAQVQCPLVHAVSAVDNWRRLEVDA